MKDKKEAYRKYFYKCLRQVFLYAVEKEYISKSPMPVLKFKVPDKIKSVLSETQAIRLLSEAKRVDWEWYPHYAVALYTGMRSGEMYALTWDKVDFDRNTILVSCSWSSKNGIKSTKSGDDRLIDIAPALLPLLKELKLQSEDQQWVLPRNDRWDRGQQAKDLRMFLQVIGLPQIRFHDLRATWATILLSKGLQPSKVMAMGGWKDMETMMIYMRKSGIDIKGSMSCLDLNKPDPEGRLISLHSL